MPSKDYQKMKEQVNARFRLRPVLS